MFQVNNKDTRTTPDNVLVFIVNFENISHLVLVFLLLTLSRWFTQTIQKRAKHKTAFCIMWKKIIPVQGNQAGNSLPKRLFI